LLGHRVDRYVWNGSASTLTFDYNLIRLRALQADDPAANPLPAIHVGGVLRFGQDGKLYIAVSDNGRRSWMQNLFCGPTATCPGPTVPDDQFGFGGFGGPEPDNAHLTGVILRLNDNGTTPDDNPFFEAYADAANDGSEVAKNIQKIFAYGIRNTFGMAIDPASGNLWLAENGEDSFSELHRIEPGQNGGWVQIRGPLSRIAQYKAIETGKGPTPCNDDPTKPPVFAGLEQDRWPGTPIAGTPAEALSRLVMLDLDHAHYRDPEFSWKFEVAPAGIGFMEGRGLGPQYQNDLFMGALEADEDFKGGYLFHFNLTANRQKIGVDDPKLEDRVADNICGSPSSRAKACSSARTSGLALISRRAPTAICSWSRSRTGRSTRSSGGTKRRAPGPADLDTSLLLRGPPDGRPLGGRSGATRQSPARSVRCRRDCFAALAMTKPFGLKHFAFTRLGRNPTIRLPHPGEPMRLFF
jgi:hypothetical protein